MKLLLKTHNPSHPFSIECSTIYLSDDHITIRYYDKTLKRVVTRRNIPLTKIDSISAGEIELEADQ